MWAALEADLRREAEEFDTEAFERSLSSPHNQSFTTFRQAVLDVACVAMVYRAGFDALTGGRIALPEYYERWVHEVGQKGGQRFQAGLTATLHCVHLDRLLPTLARAYLRGTDLTDIGRRLKLTEPPSLADVLYWSTPVAEIRNWPNHVAALFDLRLSNACRLALLSLLEARRNYVHGNDPVGQRETEQEELLCWTHASLVIGGGVARTVNGRAAPHPPTYNTSPGLG